MLKLAKPLLTKNQREYLIEIAPGKFTHEITVEMNEKFILNLTTEQVTSYMKNSRIRNGMRYKYRPQDRLLTPEQNKFLSDNILGHYNSELAEMLNDKYGLNLTAKQLKSYRNNHKMHGSGLTGRFEKGHISFNKGMKRPGTGDKATIFKPGHTPKNILPVGTVMMKADGYIWEKVSEPNIWKQKHALIWESVNGPRPKGTAIIFLDKDRTNLAVNNLACITRAELVRLNQNNLLHENTEISKAGVLIAKIMTKVGERKGKKNGKT